MNNYLKKNKIDKKPYSNIKLSYKSLYNSFPEPYQTFNHKTILKNDSLIELDIKNFLNRKVDNSNKNYLTVRNNVGFKNIFFISKEKEIKQCKSTEDLKEEDILLKKIFPYNDELNKYSNLPFFYLTRKKLNFSEDEKTNKKLLKEDFRYKISHYDRFFTNKEKNIFKRNKSIKKGITTNYINNNLIKTVNSSPNLKLELNIKNLQKNDGKIQKFSNKEKYLLFLKNKLNDLKNGNIFKKLEEDIYNFKEDNDLENLNNSKKKVEKIIKESNKNNIIKKENCLNEDNILKNKNNLKNDNKDIVKPLLSYKHFNKDINYFMKKPLKYPINFYVNKQLEIKKKRYEKSHKEGWKEFKRKINIRNLGYNSDKNKKNPLILCVLEPNRDLQKKKILTNKLIYLNECRIRDILISNKLKFEFNKDDIKRILNGQKPWTDFDSYNKDINN